MVNNPDHSVPGAGLALSGGGYRAMVFHLGALIRLNEAGLLPKLQMISSVSGGSITAGALAVTWPDLDFDASGVAANFSLVSDAVRAVADTTIDAGAIIGGILLPGDISSRVAKAYDRLLFQGRTLQDLPDPAGGAPVFTFNATNVQTGSLWRFTREHMADYQVGMVRQPTIALCDVVAASSAFPPMLSPAHLDIRQPMETLEGATLTYPPFTTQPVLSGGGVYDNMGLEALKRWRTVLVSDAGAKIAPEPAPHTDWPRHAIRVLDVIGNQVRSLRKRYLIAGYKRGDLSGCYFGIRTDISKYPGVSDVLGARALDSAPLAIIPTRLQSMPRDVQDRLINWGYAVCDAAIRCHVAGDFQSNLGIQINPPSEFPCPGAY